MSNFMYAASVPLFKQVLSAMQRNLEKAQAFAEEKKIEPNAYLQSRLFPDMFPLARQVQIACDMAKGVCARLAGLELPNHPDTEVTFDELKGRITKTLSFIEGIDAAKFDDSAGRNIVLRPGTPNERKFNGQDYLLTYGIPQVLFHVTTTYALLRHNGIAIGKNDFMGL